MSITARQYEKMQCRKCMHRDRLGSDYKPFALDGVKTAPCCYGCKQRETIYPDPVRKKKHNKKKKSRKR